MNANTVLSAPQWNYAPCSAQLGSVIVGKSMRPTWWCAKHEGERRKCVRVNSGGEVFYLDDEDGSGMKKVFELGGGPDSYHASLPVDDEESFQPARENS